MGIFDSITNPINETLFGGNKTETKRLLDPQQEGVLSQMANDANTYRGMASSSQSLYNPAWQAQQQAQVMMPMQQRMQDNMRQLSDSNRKFGRATSSIGRRLTESANMRMSQLNMQQGVLENQRRIAMEQEARQRALGYEGMANQVDSSIIGRKNQEDIVRPTEGLLSGALKAAQIGTTAANLGRQFNFGSSTPAEKSMQDVGGSGVGNPFGGY